MSHIKCIRCQLSNLWCKAVCNFKACLLGSGGEQMESMFCMLHCCNSRELSPLHAVSTWEQPLVLLCSCQKLLSGASSRANTRAPGPRRAIRPGALLSTAGHLMCHTMLLVGWPWKMVAIGIVSAGHWGRSEAFETSESGFPDSFECGSSLPHTLSSMVNGFSICYWCRTLKALTSCHIRPRFPSLSPCRSSLRVYRRAEELLFIHHSYWEPSFIYILLWNKHGHCTHAELRPDFTHF